jgi:hypothetical protein
MLNLVNSFLTYEQLLSKDNSQSQQTMSAADANAA